LVHEANIFTFSFFDFEAAVEREEEGGAGGRARDWKRGKFPAVRSSLRI